jgi:hypothetical protein
VWPGPEPRGRDRNQETFREAPGSGRILAGVGRARRL